MIELLEDTIIAISTPVARGGLGIVRLSGDQALSIAKKLFKPRSISWREIPARSLILGDVYDSQRKELIDEGYLAYFPEPRSYTREKMVEISCHGSPVILEEVVRLGIRAGARHAHPGEFTLRAYLRGRIDILQAEAINDLVSAVSLQQAEISIRQVRGRLSRTIDTLRRQVIKLLSQVEASIEFPEEGLRLSPRRMTKSLDSVISTIKRLVSSYERGKSLAEGVTLAIAGKANVGKSTLFNALLDENRAIVSPYPGTTRDFLRERIKIEESLFNLIDMAGLERPSHPIEKEGIKRGEELASKADGILIVLDSSRQEVQADLNLIRKFKGKKAILLFNKSDRPQKMDKAKCRAIDSQHPWLEISALKGTNLDRLKSIIKATFANAESKQEEVILHLRQKLLLEQILDLLQRALSLLKQGHSEEIWAEEIRRALPLIGQLTGKIKVEEVMENIFGRFCVGK
jgi:tRNA modification GTPase